MCLGQVEPPVAVTRNLGGAVEITQVELHQSGNVRVVFDDQDSEAASSKRATTVASLGRLPPSGDSTVPETRTQRLRTLIAVGKNQVWTRVASPSAKVSVSRKVICRRWKLSPEKSWAQPRESSNPEKIAVKAAV